MTVVALPEIVEFDWDAGNEQKNWRTHHVSAEEAEEPFFAEERLILEDIPHSTKEETRFILIGKSKQNKTCFLLR